MDLKVVIQKPESGFGMHVPQGFRNRITRPEQLVLCIGLVFKAFQMSVGLAEITIGWHFHFLIQTVFCGHCSLFAQVFDHLCTESIIVHETNVNKYIKAANLRPTCVQLVLIPPKRTSQLFTTGHTDKRLGIPASKLLKILCKYARMFPGPLGFLRYEWMNHHLICVIIIHRLGRLGQSAFGIFAGICMVNY